MPALRSARPCVDLVCRHKPVNGNCSETLPFGYNIPNGYTPCPAHRPWGVVGPNPFKNGSTDAHGPSIKKANKHEKEVKQAICIGTRVPKGEREQGGGRNGYIGIH